MKFITTVDEKGIEEMFIFPRGIDHDAMAEALEGIKNKTHGNWERIYRKPVAAGFVNGVGTYGRSESLDLSARPEDDRLYSQLIGRVG